MSGNDQGETWGPEDTLGVMAERAVARTRRMSAALQCALDGLPDVDRDYLILLCRQLAAGSSNSRRGSVFAAMTMELESSWWYRRELGHDATPSDSWGAPAPAPRDIVDPGSDSDGPPAA